MEFALSADQIMMQDSVKRTLERVCPLDRVKSAVGADEAVARDVWDALVELGVPALVIPEEHGGLGLTLLDAALVCEMLGRSVAPVPFVGSCVLAPLALRGSAEGKEWLPKLASGKTIAGVAISENISGVRDGASVAASNGKLNGKALFAMDFGAADIFIVADREAELYLIDANAKGLEKIALTSIDQTRSLGELNFANVDCAALNAPLSRLRDAGWAMLAADTLGAGARMIEKAVDYAKERKQFDRVIGSFQAVKHLCAEMAAELEPARALVWYAAHAFDAIPEESALTAAHAKAHLSDVGRFVARTATEVHGGIGITDLLGLHYWFKRIGLNRVLLGTPERVRHLAAKMQGFV